MPTAARSRVGTSWIASSGRPAARRPVAQAATSAREEWKLSEPPRRIAALPDLSAEPAGIGGHVGPALVDDADHAERHADARDARPLGRVHRASTRPTGSGSAAIVLEARRRSLRPLRVERQPVEQRGADAGAPRLRHVVRHWRRGSRFACARHRLRPPRAAPSPSPRPARAPAPPRPRARAAPIAAISRRVRGRCAVDQRWPSVIASRSPPDRRGG